MRPAVFSVEPQVESVSRPGSADPKALRNVSLKLRTSNLSDARRRINDVIRQAQGYVDALMTIGNPEQNTRGTSENANGTGKT